jgi:hypothetical protein
MKLEPTSDGGVRFTADRPTVLIPVPVDLDDGIRVWIDPVGPLAPLQIDAVEPDAGPTLELLVGAAAAESAREAQWAGLRGETVAPSDAVVVPGRLWADVARLGFLLWYEQYALAPLSPAHLDLEIATVATRLAPWGTDDLARSRFVRSVAELRRLAIWLRDSSDLPAIGGLVAEGLDAYLRGYADELPDAVADDLEELRGAALASAEADAHGAVSDASITRLLVSFHGHARATAARGAETTPAGTGRFSVDWEHVTRGVLDPGEDTVTAVWNQNDHRLEVEVRAAASSRPVSDLMVRVQRAAGSTPATAAPLRFDDSRLLYVASFPLDAPLAAGDRVDIAVTGDPRPVTTGDATALRKARRGAAWGLCLERLMLLSDEPDEGVFGSAEEAWSAAGAQFRAIDPEAAKVCNDRSRRLAETLTPESQHAFIASLPAVTLAELLSAQEPLDA